MKHPKTLEVRYSQSPDYVREIVDKLRELERVIVIGIHQRGEPKRYEIKIEEEGCGIPSPMSTGLDHLIDDGKIRIRDYTVVNEDGNVFLWVEPLGSE